MTKVRISKEEIKKQINWGRFDLGTSNTDFIEVEGEIIDTIKIVPSARIDYCADCKTEHGYDCPLDNVEEKCEHNRKRYDIRLGSYCYDCGKLFPAQSPIIEEMKTEMDGYTFIPSIRDVRDKLNDLIRAVNLLRK